MYNDFKVYRRLVSAKPEEAETTLDMVALNSSLAVTEGFSQSYLAYVLGLKTMMIFLHSNMYREFYRDDTADESVKLTPTFLLPGTKEAFYVELREGSSQSIVLESLTRVIQRAKYSEIDVGWPDAVPMKLADYAEHQMDALFDDAVISYFAELLEKEKNDVTLEDIVTMSDKLRALVPTHKPDINSIIHDDILEYCKWCNRGVKKLDLNDPKDVEEAKDILVECTAAVMQREGKSDAMDDFNGLVSLCQVLKVDKIIPGEHTWMPYEDTYKVIALDMNTGNIVKEFYCDARLGCAKYTYKDYLRVTYNDTMEGCMITGIKKLNVNHLHRVESEFKVTGRVTEVSNVDNSSEMKKVSIDLSEPTIIGCSTYSDRVYDIIWFEEDAGTIPSVGDIVSVVAKRSPGSLNWYTVGNEAERKFATSEDTSLMSELDRLQKELNEDLC